MSDPNSDRLVLPFQAALRGAVGFLTFEQVFVLLKHGQRALVHIERSYPGAPEAIGWTVFRRGARTCHHDGEPLFRSEGEAHRHLRKVYAVEHALNTDDLLTCSHLEL